MTGRYDSEVCPVRTQWLSGGVGLVSQILTGFRSPNALTAQ
jgi:hypothetical protein